MKNEQSLTLLRALQLFDFNYVKTFNDSVKSSKAFFVYFSKKKSAKILPKFLKDRENPSKEPNQQQKLKNIFRTPSENT